MKFRIKLLIISLAFFLCHNPVFAQVDPIDVEAGAIGKEVKTKTKYKDLLEEKKEEEEKTKDEAKLKLNVEEKKSLEGEVKKEGFVLKDVIYEGNTAFTEEELDEISSAYLNTYVTLDDLRVIMHKITDQYKAEGYITSFAYLPAQGIQNGVLKVGVSEGKISGLNIKGNKWSRESYLLNNKLRANGVKEGRVLNVNNLEKTLGKVNEMDYIQGRIILNKGETLDSSEITLEVEERAPLMFRAGWNNQGRDLIGKQRAILTLGDENITGYGDKIYGSTMFAEDTFGVFTDYILPLGPYGTELRTGYGYTNAEVGKAYEALGFKGKAHGFHIGLFQPIYEGKTFKVTSDATFDALYSKVYQQKSIIYDKYDLRVLRTGLNAIKDDSQGRWIGRFEVSTGIPILGATSSPTPNGNGADSKFIKFNPSLLRIQALPWNMTGLFKAAGQFTPSALLPVEQLQMGGMNTVRGYEESILFAQKAYYVNLEVRKPIPGLPDYKYLKLKDRIEFAVFHDHGLAKVRGVKLSANSGLLQSVGFGLRIHLTEYLNANLDFGFPIGGSKNGQQKDPMKFHFRITSDII